MSKNLKKFKNFLILMLITNRTQAKALLQTITSGQVEAIVEIVYNLMNIASTVSDKAVLRKRRTYLKKLANKKTSLSAKKRLIVKHRAKLLKTLLHFKKVLLKLLK